MAARLRPVSGRKAIKILCNRFGFRVVRQRGSHVALRKETPTGPIGTVIPLHGEVALPTLRSVLKMARVSEADFADEL